MNIFNLLSMLLVPSILLLPQTAVAAATAEPTPSSPKSILRRSTPDKPKHNRHISFNDTLTYFVGSSKKRSSYAENPTNDEPGAEEKSLKDEANKVAEVLRQTDADLIAEAAEIASNITYEIITICPTGYTVNFTHFMHIFDIYKRLLVVEGLPYNLALRRKLGRYLNSLAMTVSEELNAHTLTTLKMAIGEVQAMIRLAQTGKPGTFIEQTEEPDIWRRKLTESMISLARLETTPGKLHECIMECNRARVTVKKAICILENNLDTEAIAVFDQAAQEKFDELINLNAIITTEETSQADFL